MRQPIKKAYLSCVFDNVKHEHQPWRYRSLPSPVPKIISVADAHAIINDQLAYQVSAKTDGQRIALFIRGSSVILFNRSFDPYDEFRNVDADARHCILDGELINEVTPTFRDEAGAATGGGRIVIHDCICMGGQYIGNRPYTERLAAASSKLTWLNTVCEMGGYSVVVKKTWPATPEGVREALRHNNMVHGDGLVFTRVLATFCESIRGSNDILKWKRPEDASIDMLLKNGGEMYVQFNNKPIMLDKVHNGNIRAAPGDHIRNHENGVFECVMTPQGWDVIRLRPDKNRPNSIAVACQNMMFQSCASHILKLLSE